MVLLVEGTFRIDLTQGSTTLARQGDYLVWGPGIDHAWEALARQSSSPFGGRPRRRKPIAGTVRQYRATYWGSPHTCRAREP
jgi:hypothetical protein